MSTQLIDLNKRISEINLQVNDIDMANKKSQAENSDLLRNLEEVDQNVSMLSKVKNQLNNELEDVKKFCDDEAKERQSLMGRFRNLEQMLQRANKQTDRKRTGEKRTGE